MHLRAPVPGERFVELLRQLPGVVDERIDDCLRVLAVQIQLPV